MLLCIAVSDLFGQSVGVKADRNQVLIGERVQYDLMVNLPTPGYAMNFNLPDSVPHFEVIENINFDTLSTNGGAFLIHKKLILTSFDSGTWYIPSFQVIVQRNNTARTFNTDSILVDVGYSPSDSTNALRDIKPVMEVNVTDYFWIYVASIVLGLLIIGYLIYNYFKNRKKKPVPVFHSELTPYQEAMKALDDLRKYDLQKPVDIKLFHSSLTEIFKKYYSRKLGRNLFDKTTGDILITLNEQQDPGSVSAIAEALRCTDAVKFAKYIPVASESNHSAARVKVTIDGIEKNDSPTKTN
ncbi:MAG: hypothetical protein ABIO04_03370 [Ferruginibacter sp.]